DLAGREVLVAIDQEGGRVARLKPPHWPSFPAAGAFARLYEKAPMSAIEAARANAEAMGLTLAEAGINMDFAPVLDLAHEGAHEIVGDRSFGAEPIQVAALGRAVLDGLAAAGIAGCIKHMPGHGRCPVDSHWTLPVVGASREELEADFAPFRALASRAPAAMVAHILYTALDPERPASISPTIIAGLVHRELGFDGLLLSDDIAMKALTGTPAETARAVVQAGCDLALHCSGDLGEMEEVAAAIGPLDEAAVARLDSAVATPAPSSTNAVEALTAKRDALLALAPS
ncbi:MAG TPA: glycoside hydrolase family 3 N-terminal domain-containing protein, partial [Allosphingosinicella sp.]